MDGMLTMKNKGKLLLIGYRAYGDWVYSVPVLPYLFKDYDVHIELNGKGYELFYDDPRFEWITMFRMEKYPMEQWENRVFERWEELERRLKPDRTINLWRTLETECIAERYMDEFFLPVNERQEIFGDKCFYDAVFDKCNIAVPSEPKLDELYYTQDQLEWGQRWRAKHEGQFVIIMPIAGSCSQKVYPDMPRLTYELLDKYPDAFIYLVGDKSVAHAQWDHERIKKICGDVSIKQVFLMTKYADMVIGGETGVVVSAGMWGTPKIMLCTSSSVEQCVKYQKNDYSMQSQISCSPCHKAIYTMSDCDSMMKDGEDIYPDCIMQFEYEEILRRVDAVRQGILSEVC